jgi:ATP-binding cassette, subfamily B, multidrug efflux pump
LERSAVFAWFEKLIHPYPAEEPGMPPRGLVAFCYHYTRPALPWLIAGAGFTAATSVIEVALFGFLGSLVDWLSSADRATFFDVHGSDLLWIGFLLLVALPASSFVQSLLMFQTIYGNFPMQIRWKAHRYILGQSLGFFQNEFAGRVSQKVMQTALAVRETVTKLLDVFVYVVVYFTGALVLMARADLWLAVPMLVWLVAYVGILWRYLPKLQAISGKQADARAQMTGRIVDSYTNIQTIKLFAHTRREQDYARDAMDGFMTTVYPQMRFVTQLTLALNIVNSLLLAAVAGASIYAWQQDLVSLGAIAVAIALVMRLRAMSQWIFWETANLFENIGTVQDGMNTLSQPVTIADRQEARPLVVSQGAIRFNRARFHYGRATRVIEDFSLTISPGEKVGIVGRSGAGKSTLVNLLLRFHDLEGGRIFIDGQDIAGVTQESLRGAIGMVTQDTSLLHRSVRENIAYGRPEASEEEIVAAAREAHADDFIRTLADSKGRHGYDAHVGERGVKLSGGQRQRIAIARVLLKDAPILVLDEATSALDSEVEAAIQESLYRLMKGKTVIAIAHRLSTLAAMDRLVVLDKGRIVEIGNHDGLLRHGGLYAQLWSRQSGGFLDAELMTAAE